MFELNRDYASEDIQAQCGGNRQAFLPIYKGKVAAACLQSHLNPRAPEAIVCNTGGAARSAGRTLARQRDPIPVFIWRENSRWRYVGDTLANTRRLNH